MDGRIFDGHVAVFGQNTVDDPSELPSSVAAKAVNRIFRGGRNRTRPPFVHYPFEFDTSAQPYEDLVRRGNYQGSFAYRKKKPGREDGWLVSVAGFILFLTLVNETWRVRVVFAGNDPKLLHTWFCQVEEWVYIQNGKDRPIFWNGLFPSTARRADPEQNEMPIGTIMVAAHGRVFLSNAFNQVAASDIIHGNGLTRSDAPQKFTENLYWAEGGYFGLPLDLDEITGMIVVARQDQNNRGQGEVLVVSRDGAYSLEASLPRGNWKTAQMQVVTLMGRGNESPTALINVNNDVFMRSDDGLSSYNMSRSEQRGRFSFSKMSRHVNLWTDTDSDYLLRFSSLLYFDNRVQNGIIYYTVGSGASNLNGFISDSPYSRFRYSLSGALFLEATKAKLTFSFKNVAGEVLDVRELVNLDPVPVVHCPQNGYGGCPPNGFRVKVVFESPADRGVELIFQGNGADHRDISLTRKCEDAFVDCIGDSTDRWMVSLRYVIKPRTVGRVRVYAYDGINEEMLIAVYEPDDVNPELT